METFERKEMIERTSKKDTERRERTSERKSVRQQEELTRRKRKGQSVTKTETK